MASEGPGTSGVLNWIDIDWSAVTVMVFAAFGLVALIRGLMWLTRDGARRFRYWPEVVLVAGVCAL
jgi:hypothetical protein